MAKSFSELLRCWHEPCAPSSFAEMYDIGRRVRNCVVSLRDGGGQDFQQAADLLRRVDKLCKDKLKDWEPPHEPN